VKKVLQEVSDNRVKAYVIWDPIFGGNFNRAAKELSVSFPDRRVSYFKDPDSLAGTVWKQVLNLDREIAWDVYFLYDADAQWDKEPPQPDFWMHQLYGVTNGPRLDAEKFKEELRGLLNKPGSKDSRKVRQ
jgi:hypothetical protein